MAPHSSTLAWEIPWMEEPGRLQSTGSRRVGHDWATSLSLFMHWRRKWQPTPVFLPGESQGRGAWWAAIYGVSQSRTWLKSLSIVIWTTVSVSSNLGSKSWHFLSIFSHSANQILCLLPEYVSLRFSLGLQYHLHSYPYNWLIGFPILPLFLPSGSR